jgi:hypothetical protein
MILNRDCIDAGFDADARRRGRWEAFVLLFRTPSAAARPFAESFNSELKGTSTIRVD